MQTSFERAAEEIIKAGHRLDNLGLAPATAGNYSVRTEDGQIAITVSGMYKGDLKKDGIMRVDLDGKPLEDKKPSAETLLHTLIYDLYPDVNAVLHTHSVPCVVLTRIDPQASHIVLDGYELLKAFPGIDTHDTQIRLPIFDNTQDMKALSRDVMEVLKDKQKTPAFLIRNHGLYGWGKNMKEASQVVEALEVLLSCELEIQKLQKGAIR